MKSITSVITVLSARRFDFKNDDGEQVEGVKIFYVEDWEPEERQNGKGVELLEATLPLEIWSRMSPEPADYNAHFNLVRGQKGKAMLQVTDIEHIQPFKPFASAKISPNQK